MIDFGYINQETNKRLPNKFQNMDFEEFMNKQYIVDMVFPYTSIYTKHNPELYVQNPNMICLIIDSMALALFLPTHIGEKFCFIKNAILYDDDDNDENTDDVEYKAKIIHIDHDWDTRKWSYTKIKSFYKILHIIEDKTPEEIEYLGKEHEIPFDDYHNIDIQFLTSLLWNSHLS